MPAPYWRLVFPGLSSRLHLPTSLEVVGGGKTTKWPGIRARSDDVRNGGLGVALQNTASRSLS